MGRADQTTKIKGMFIRPEQVAEFVGRHDEITKARVVATRDGDSDVMTVQIEAQSGDPSKFESSIQAVMKIRGVIEIVTQGSLPNDGKVIDDQRSYD
jgi:phenylacetate-CoA ligase